MTEIDYTALANLRRIQLLLKNIKGVQRVFLENIIQMSNQEPNFQAIEEKVSKHTYDSYFHFLIPKKSDKINCKRVLSEAGINIQIDFDLDKKGNDTAFTISVGEIEKSNGYYIKFIKQ